ncbi:MAG: hypothetical protein SWY16_09600 [Cyanobacteriota bacterium]|nr:hypothetical protein [Cyanobacteriota bacterium]
MYFNISTQYLICQNPAIDSDLAGFFRGGNGVDILSSIDRSRTCNTHNPKARELRYFDRSLYQGVAID